MVPSRIWGCCGLLFSNVRVMNAIRIELLLLLGLLELFELFMRVARVIRVMRVRLFKFLGC